MIRLPAPGYFPPQLLEYFEFKNEDIEVPQYAIVVADELLKKVPFQHRLITPLLLRIVIKSNFGHIIQ